MVIKDWIGSLRRQARLSRAESGQSLIILALAFLGLIAMLGLALDLGVLYIERIHLKRAVDAATLAGVVELPNEEAAMTRAIDYLRANGYDVGSDVAVKVAGCTKSSPGANINTLVNWTNPITPHNYITVPNPRATFILDTFTYQARIDGTDDCNRATDTYGSANKLAITGTVTVGMNFMQFFGFSSAPASDTGAAENITNLDVAVIFDNSGSMEADTVCYDCWHENSEDVTINPFPGNGTYLPISYTAMINNALCVTTSTPYVANSNRYIIMEAELYSRTANGSWYREGRASGQGYWAIQRGDTDDPRASSIDGSFSTGGSRSAYVTHNPYWTYGQSAPPAPLLGRFYSLAQARADAAPRLDYDFTPDWDGTAYVWIRAQAGGAYSFALDQVDGSGNFVRNGDKLYWAVDDPAQAAENTSATQWCNTNYSYAGCYQTTIIHNDNVCTGCKNKWLWFRLGSVTVSAGSHHTLKLWAGSPGYSIDKIVITNNGSNSLNSTSAGAGGVSPNNALTANSNRGRPATQGSARGGAPVGQAGACDPCNPIFGLTVHPTDCTSSYYQVTRDPTNNLGDELFGDREPLRTSIEATKRFVKKLDPHYDQVSFIGFDANVNQQAELTCLRRQTILGNPTGCFAGTGAISYTNVLQSLENQTANGNTNIAEAMRNALETLGYNVDGRGGGVDNKCDGSPNSACGRGGAARRVIVLLTDGSPNKYPSGHCADDPSLWPYNSEESFDCVMYYAKKASQANTIIYTIGLGNGAVPELLEAVAEETHGTYFWASSPSKLDAIFDQILSNIYVRLIQ